MELVYFVFTSRIDIIIQIFYPKWIAGFQRGGSIKAHQ